MKILMSCRQHPHHLCGGLSIASWNTARSAVDAGHEVDYLTAARLDDPSVRRTVEDGVNVHWLEGMFHDSTGYPVLYKWCADNRDELCAKYDLFHSQSSALTTLLNEGVPIVFQDHGTQLAALQDDVNMTVILQAKFNIAITASFRKDLPYTEMYNDLTLCIEGREIDYLRRFDRILATSEVSAMDLWTRYYLRTVSVYHHPIYGLPAFTPRSSVNPDRPVVGFFTLSLDAPQKYAKLGMKALLPLKDKITIKLIGNGPHADKWARENFPHVIYTGYIKEDQAIKELSEVDVLFECSCHHRGCNLTGITALGLGVPIVAYPVGGHPDLVGVESMERDYGPGGALVDPFDDLAAIEAVTDILDNRLKFSESARGLFDRVFSPPVCAKRLNEIYADTLPG